ncbi:MAG: S8 family serine peptidase, partial [Deinococcus sp.]|nr:S8 family serine peptidase [Deinococcus sp.]
MRPGYLLALLGTLSAGCSPASPVPRVTGMIPSQGVTDSVVTVVGANLSGGALGLSIGQEPAQLLAIGPDYATAQVPWVPGGLQPVTVTVRGFSFQLWFTVLPEITALLLQGHTLVIQGTGFAPVPQGNTVLVGDVAIVPVAGNAAELQVALPAGLRGHLPVQVMTRGAASASRLVLLQAGGVKGQVVLPGPRDILFTRYQSSVSNERFWADELSAPHGSELLLQLVPGAPTSQLPLPWGGTFDTPWAGLVRLQLPPEADLSAGLAYYAQVPGVAAVEVNNRLSLPPTAAQLAPLEQRAVPDESLLAQWYLERLGAPELWARSQGAGVVVAVVDSGVRSDHPDLEVLPGYDFIDQDADPADQHGHGTHVAGIIAARRNGLGAAGLAPEALILPVRVLDQAGQGTDLTVAQGIRYAAGLLPAPTHPYQVAIITLSLGSPQPTPTIAAASSEAMQRGILVVAAAGNDRGAVNYPARYPEAIAVGAVSGPVGTPYLAPYSSQGSELEVMAFGGDLSADRDGNGSPDGIWSTDWSPAQGVGYGLRQGTSMAVPQVAATLALMLSAGIPRTRARSLLAGTAWDLDLVGRDPLYGHGLINPPLALGQEPLTVVWAQDSTGQVLAQTLA